MQIASTGLPFTGAVRSVFGPALEMTTLQEIIQKSFRIFRAAKLGIKYPVRAVFVQAHADEIGCPYLADLFVDGVVAIQK